MAPYWSHTSDSTPAIPSLIVPRAVHREREYESTSDGTVYTLKGLDSEAEVDSWAAFCAAVFSYKENPPPSCYFSRHFFNDPHRGHSSFIRVAYYSNNNNHQQQQQQQHCDRDNHTQLVASCRILWRCIADGNGGCLFAAGIGEVCTRTDHQRRGLSRQLLQDALDIVDATHDASTDKTTTTRVDVVMLHAACTFFPLYQSVGFVLGPESLGKVIPMHFMPRPESHDDRNREWVIRLAHFPTDTADLMRLYQQYTVQRRLVGCIQRSMEYWEQYICGELEGTLWVMVHCRHGQDDEQKEIDAPSSHPNEHHLMGWISIRPRGNQFQVRDFGCALPPAPTSSSSFSPTALFDSYEIFSRLLAKALPKEYIPDVSSSSTPLQLHVPQVVFQDIRNSYYQRKVTAASATNAVDASVNHSNSSSAVRITLDLENAVQQNDGGWMYRPITQRASDWLERTTITSECPHLIWPADSF